MSITAVPPSSYCGFDCFGEFVSVACVVVGDPVGDPGELPGLAPVFLGFELGPDRGPLGVLGAA
jgi:hypothetical protein